MKILYISRHPEITKRNACETFLLKPSSATGNDVCETPCGNTKIKFATFLATFSGCHFDRIIVQMDEETVNEQSDELADWIEDVLPTRMIDPRQKVEVLISIGGLGG